MDYEIHPAAELFPLLNGKEYEAFKADIAERGLIEAIWLCDGKILDGRNRYRACRELGVEPSFQSYEGDSPVQFAWSLNGQRRHLTPSQLAAIAAKMLPQLQAEAQKRKAHGQTAPGKRSGSIESKRSAVEAGEIVGVGHATVNRAARIQREAPELFAEVEAGRMTVNKALATISEQQAAPHAPREQRLKQIRKLVREGHRASQIAAELGMHEKTIKAYAKDAGIKLPDDTIKGTRINVFRAVENTVHGLSGYALGLQMVTELKGVDSDIAAEWAESLKRSIAPIQLLRRKLLRIANGN